MPSFSGCWETFRNPLLFLAAFLFLLTGVNPGFYADDSAETITAAVLLGVAHPPGYPFFTLLGHFLSFLPLGGFGFRVNLLSALLAALNCVLLFQLFQKWVKLPESWAFVLALFWVTGASAYPGALSAKTGLYQLTAALILGILLALVEVKWEMAGFLFGLSLANHWMTLLVLAPGIFLFARDQAQGGGTRAKLWLGFVAGVLSLSLYLFLPLRAVHSPLLNWGEPGSLSSFWFHLTRAEYGGAEHNGGALNWAAQAFDLLKRYFMEWPGLFLAALAGAFIAWKNEPKMVRGLLAGWLSLWVVLSLYLNLPAARFYLLGEYALAGQTLILVFTAFALKAVFQRLQGKLLIFLALALVLLGLGIFRDLRDRQTHYTYAYDYGLNAFQELPKGSLYYAKGDGLVFPAWYFQWVEKKRPDLAFVGVDGLPMDWIRRDLAKSHPDLHVPLTDERLGLESIPTLMSWMAEKNTDHPFYLSFEDLDPRILPGAALAPEGIVNRVNREGPVSLLTDAQQMEAWNRLRLRNRPPENPVDERTALFFFSNYAFKRNALGLTAENQGDDFRAQAKDKKAAAYYLKAQEAYGRAFRDYAWAQEWYPLEPKYAYNVGNALVHLGRNQEALDYYQKAWDLNPRYKEAYFNAAIAAFYLGQTQRAGGYFSRVLALDPNYPQARSNLDYLVKSGGYHP